jgi:oxygen-dependent protoporphyrinogen oxidase
MPKVVIVGAGISGLATAYRLQQMAPTVEVVVLERGNRPGGTIWTERQAGFQVEIGPNGFLDTNPATIQLCLDLGLKDQLIPASEAAGRNRFLFINGKLRALPHSLETFLHSDLLSWRGKLHVLLERFRPKHKSVEDESIDAFARRRAGREAAEVFADALVTGIHAGDPALLSVRAAFPRLTALEAQYGSILKGLGRQARERRRQRAASGEPFQRSGRMWSFREGLRLLVETINRQLRRPPILGVSVRRIERTETQNLSRSERATSWTVLGEGGERWFADAVILTCPAYQQAAILAELDKQLAEQISTILYNRVAVVALGYRREDVPANVDGFGYIAPQRTRGDLLGVQWCSSIFPERAPNGNVLFRALCGGWHRPDVVGWDDDRLLSAVRAELQLAVGITAAPIFHHIIRWDHAIPQYHLGHLERVAHLEERAAQYPGLFLGGSAYHGIAMNDCTEQAERLAKRVSGFLEEGSGARSRPRQTS